MSSRDLTAFGYRRIVILLVSLIVVPTSLMLAVGVLLLFLGEPRFNLLMGILVVALSGAAATGVILVWVFVRREANLSRLQSDFVSKVSHELKTPLTSIRLFSETLAMRRGDVAQEDKCIAALSQETGRLQELIERLLDWGRMESGRREYVRVETTVQAVISDTLASFEAVRDFQSIELDVDVADGDTVLFVDQGALADALLNLLTNAFKYGGEPARIGVRVTTTSKEVMISVVDNGIGIPKVEHKRIFQKFYRVDDRLSSEREGSGLGLAIVKHIVRAHRGRVELESQPGLGSTFSMVLPRRRG